MTARLGRSAAWIAAVLGVVACLAAVAYYSRHAPAQHAHSTRNPQSRNPRSANRSYPPVTGERFERANVVVITIDTLRRDYLAPYGAAFATNAATRLAREGAVFEHAVSQVPLTLPSHASIFTGLYPPHHAVRDNGFVLNPGVTTLAERLQASGYATAGFVSSVRAPFTLGYRARTRRLRRLLRLSRAREPQSRRRRATGGSGDRGCAGVAARVEARLPSVLSLGSPLRSP